MKTFIRQSRLRILQQLQHLAGAATDPLPVCDIECSPVLSSVLGGGGREEEEEASCFDNLLRKTGSVVGTELHSLISVAVLDAEQAPVHDGQSRCTATSTDTIFHNFTPTKRQLNINPNGRGVNILHGRAYIKEILHMTCPFTL